MVPVWPSRLWQTVKVNRLTAIVACCHLNARTPMRATLTGTAPLGLYHRPVVMAGFPLGLADHVRSILTSDHDKPLRKEQTLVVVNVTMAMQGTIHPGTRTHTYWWVWSLSTGKPCHPLGTQVIWDVHVLQNMMPTLLIIIVLVTTKAILSLKRQHENLKCFPFQPLSFSPSSFFCLTTPTTRQTMVSPFL